MYEPIKEDFEEYLEWFVKHFDDEQDRADYLDPEARRGMLEDFHKWLTAGQPHDSVRDLVTGLLMDPQLYNEVNGMMAMAAFRDFQIEKAVDEITGPEEGQA